MIPIKSDKDIRVMSFHHNYLYIGTRTYEIIVLDFDNGKADDEGGLYLWKWNENPDPRRLELDGNGRVKIIGIDAL